MLGLIAKGNPKGGSRMWVAILDYRPTFYLFFLKGGDFMVNKGIILDKKEIRKLQEIEQKHLEYASKENRKGYVEFKSPLGEYNQAILKEYSDGTKTFWKFIYLRFLVNSGIEIPKKDDIQRPCTKKSFLDFCNQNKLDKMNIEEIESKCFEYLNCPIMTKEENKEVQSVLLYLQNLKDYKKRFGHIKRARDTVFEYASCNNFSYFVTLTFDKEKVKTREDLDILQPEFAKWLNNYKNNKKLKDFKYLLLPEKHKKGGWHLHGLMIGIPEQDLVPFSEDHKGSKYINDKVKKGGIIYDWTSWAKRFGFCDIEPIQNKEAVEKYITKYISKSLGQDLTNKNAQMYYVSKGLKKSTIKAKGTYSAKVDATDKKYFDFVGEYVSTKTIDNLEDLDFYLSLIE